MKFEFLADAVEIPPERPTNPSVGYPSDGDARTGRAPTTLGAWFFYMLMVEFTTLLEQNGIEPDAENLHQLADFFAEYKTQLEGFKGSAQEFKVAAEAAATQAATKAVEAANSASGASSSASQAANSASQADASKNAAKVSETNAKNSETAAASSASSAQVSANTASQKSVDASNSAISAENAKAGAESARDEAKGYAESMGNPLGKDEAAQTYATKAEMASGLAGKADSSHAHTTAQIEGLDIALAGKAAVSHTHEVADVNGLQDALDGKQAAGDYATNTALAQGLAGKANSSHSHAYVPTSGGTVSGNLTVTGTLKGGTVQSTSDRRLKINVHTLNDIDLSEVRTYRYILKSDFKEHVGLIAQEVMTVLPEAVAVDEKGYLSLDYNAIVAVLVSKINQQEKRIQQLEAHYGN